MTANESWLNLLTDVMENGLTSSPRGMKIKEIIGYSSTTDLQKPLVTIVDRKLSRKFLAGEAYWILSGDNKVSTIAPYNSAISKFSDDGRYFNGAYGPRVADQLTYVVDSLVQDKDTRQAVMTIWRSNPRPSKDIPCTISAQWLIRMNEIHCIDTMRSSDSWLGIPYDIFNFSMLTTLVALMYRERTQVALKPGTITMQCGSQHAYEKNWEAASKIVFQKKPKEIEYRPLTFNDFESPEHLMTHLQEIRDGAVPSSGKFMAELL